MKEKKEVNSPKKVKKYTVEEARIIIQQNIAKANKEIDTILKKYGLTLRVVHSVEIVPNIEQRR